MRKPKRKKKLPLHRQLGYRFCRFWMFMKLHNYFEINGSEPIEVDDPKVDHVRLIATEVMRAAQRHKLIEPPPLKKRRKR